MSTGVNCGQVRGPIQLTFARSVDPIVASEHSITRMAVATEAEAEKQQGDNRTMGRKHTVPYGLYVAHGFVSSFLAKQTGFSDDDLAVLWDALSSMFEHDRSAARSEMATRGLYVFKHDSELGNAPAHKLFDLIQVKRSNGSEGPPRSFSDYSVTSPQEGPIKGFSGVSFVNKVG
jgi:CRISPR-associated protein Csd2